MRTKCLVSQRASKDARTVVESPAMGIFSNDCRAICQYP